MKAILCLTLLSILAACTSPRFLSESDPLQNAASRSAKREQCAMVENNEMDDYIMVSIDTHRCSDQLEGNSDMYAFPRAVIDKRTKRVTYQVYVFVHGQDWYFLHSYRYLMKGKLEPEKSLTQIDRSVGAGIREDYVFDLSSDRFKLFTDIEMKIRVYGKRNNGEITVRPSLFSEVFRAAQVEISQK